jgi:geranylgeranylglycerol-phosphate geranylgeranyltransferase
MESIHPTIPPYSIHFWSNYLIQMRPYLFFVSGMAGLAGMSVLPDLKLSSVYSLLLLFAFFFSYGFGQALTDCYQTDTDQISAPYRPLSRGILSIQHVKYTSIIGLFAAAFIIVTHNFYNLFLCALSIIGLWSYSYFKRNYWFAGPFYNGWIVALLPIIGYLASSKLSINHTIDKNILIVALLTFFSYTNFVLIGYLKDITADEHTGYKTFPVVFGWTSTVWVGDAVLLLCSTVYVFSFTANLQGLLF